MATNAQILHGINYAGYVDKRLISKARSFTLNRVSRKSKNFYYLFPGQGRGARKRFIRNLIAALVVGCLTAGLMAWIFYLIES